MSTSHLMSIAFAIGILPIIVNEIKKKLRKENIIIKCLNGINKDLFFSLLWCCFALIMFRFYIRSYLEYKSFFIPDYFNKWYYMLSYEKLELLEALLLENGKDTWHELIRLYFYKSGLKSLYLGLIWLISSWMYLYFGIQKTYFHNDGFRVRNTNYKWNDIKGYVWHSSTNKDHIKSVPDFDKLTLHIGYDALSKKIMNQDTLEIKTKIRSIDKSYVNKLLTTNNIDEKI